jgi:hypothetical protein
MLKDLVNPGQHSAPLVLWCVLLAFAAWRAGLPWVGSIGVLAVVHHAARLLERLLAAQPQLGVLVLLRGAALLTFLDGFLVLLGV